MTTEKAVPICTGQTKAGNPCKSRVKEGHTLCWRHDPDYEKKPKKTTKKVDLSKFEDKLDDIQELIGEILEVSEESQLLNDLDDEVKELAKVLKDTKL